ncbi:hypothetical protein GCM10025298_22200 [Natronobiforma cellulositropha]|nr:hypothetical protein [Natronobiforma cellulositropha]
MTTDTTTDDTNLAPLLEDPIDTEAILLECGAVEPCEDDDLCVTDDLDAAWRERMDAMHKGDREAQLTEFFGFDDEDLEVDVEISIEMTEEGYVFVRANNRLAARWESDAAALADVAGEQVLGDWIPGWEGLSLEQRSQIVNGLRAFVERCPSCEGELSLSEETVESCCRTRETYAIFCDDCNARIIEVNKVNRKEREAAAE